MKLPVLSIATFLFSAHLFAAGNATGIFDKIKSNAENANITILKIYPKMPGIVFHTLSYAEKRAQTQVALRIDYDKNSIKDDIVFSYTGLHKSAYPNAKVQSFTNFMKDFEPDHEIEQYSIRLRDWEKKRILKEVASRTERGSKRQLRGSNNLSNYLLTAIDNNTGFQSMRDNDNDFTRQIDFNNAYALEKNLRAIDVRLTHTNFRFKRAVDEMCAHEPHSLASCVHSALEFNDNLDSVLAASDEFAQKVRDTFSKVNSEHRAYINGDQITALNELAHDYVALDDAFFRIERDTMISTKEYRLNLMIELFRQVSRDYRYVRFFEEGAIDKSYASFFMHDIYDNAKVWRKNTSSNLSSEVMRKVWKHFDSDLDRLGNNLASGLVNFLGQIFKKRKYVPKLRWEANFRDNFLTKFRTRTLTDLFDNNPMMPGDIILEKDLKANNDVIIPGYWLHASIYLGTMHEFKRMGVWDLESFKNIRADIERYRTDKDWIKFLREKLKVKMKFEDIPWFVESDRPGVGVHPIQKFLQTDGMVVLRPTSKDWNENAVKRIYTRVNERIGFPYDYTHSVRNKMAVTCSKFVLKVFDTIDFPVSNNLKYITHSPDQTGAPVSMDRTQPELGQLEVIKFFDAYDKGKIRYDSAKSDTFSNYTKYLESIKDAQ